jgi:hypothetical protein
MTRDELRAAIQDGCDKVLSLPRLLVSHEQRRVVHATRVYWETAPDAELDRLLSLVPDAINETTPPKSMEQRLWSVEVKVELILRQLSDISDVLASLNPPLLQSQQRGETT